MPDAGPSRRAVLLGTAAFTAAFTATACGKRSGPGSESNDEVIVRRVAADKHAILERYEATVAQHPDKRGVLAPLSAEHERHLALLDVPEPSGTPAPGRPSSGAAPTGSQAPVRIPASVREALDSLGDAEQKTSDARMADILTASPGLARLLASISACEAVHAQLLRSAS